MISKNLKKNLLDNIKYFGNEYELLVNRVIKKGDLNLINKNGYTALHYFSYINDNQTLELLLKEGANPNIKNDMGDTPLSIAINEGFWGVVKLLLEYNADTSISNSDGVSAFDSIINYLKDYFGLIEEKVKSGILEEDVQNIISNLDMFKLLGVLSMEEEKTVVYDIYKIVYEYMKLEFLYNCDSKIYEYFISNDYDKNYIEEFIKEDIEYVISSINYIDGLDELKNLIKDRSDYLDEDIIKLLSRITNPFIISEEVSIMNEFEEVYSEFEKLKSKYIKILIGRSNKFNIFTPDDFKVLDRYEKEYCQIESKFKKLKAKKDNFFKVNSLRIELIEDELKTFSKRQLGIVRIGRSI